VILLDTNVLSALMRGMPDATLRSWLDRQPASEIWTTSITVFELRFGIARLPEGRRRQGLAAMLDAMMREDLGGRIAAFDHAAASEAARLAARREAAGRPVGAQDTMIAGIALSRRAVLATRNLRHFEDLDTGVVDPWAG
jgi:predicted nucleic acid-binding protein